MRYVKPDYYDAFQCVADKCPDSCCAGWQIMIDDASLEKYQQVKDAFGKRLQSQIDWREGSFMQYGGRCAMLNEENLCDLVIEKGEEWLCETCDRYPRHVEEYDGVREWSLSLSCPVAAGMILDKKKPLALLVEEDEEADPLEEEFEEFDFLLYTKLEDARNVLFQIAQNASKSIAQRLALIEEMAMQLQLCIEEERLYDMDDLIAAFQERAHGSEELPLLEGEVRFKELQKRFGYLEQLEHLRSEWTKVLENARRELYNRGYEQYQEKYSSFVNELHQDGAKEKEWEQIQENLLMFFLYTYFCGAVYDEWIYSKAAMAVYSVVFIQELVMCRGILTDKAIDIQDYIEVAYQYAREVEHSDDNLNLLEELLQQEFYAKTEGNEPIETKGVRG